MDKKLKRLMNGHKVQFKHGELEHLPHDIFDDVNANIIMKKHINLIKLVPNLSIS